MAVISLNGRGRHKPVPSDQVCLGCLLPECVETFEGQERQQCSFLQDCPWIIAEPIKKQYGLQIQEVTPLLLIFQEWRRQGHNYTARHVERMAQIVAERKAIG